MTVITVILALLAERFLVTLDEYRRYEPYDRYLTRLDRKAGLGVGRELVLIAAGVALPAVLAHWAIHVLGDIWFLLEIAANTALLLFCMGPRSFYESAKGFCSSYGDGSREGARWYWEAVVGRAATENEQKNLAGALAQQLFVITHGRLFGVLFWFVLLGPFGALCFRLLHYIAIWLEQHWQSDNKTDLVPLAIYYLEWPSAHVLALLYALAGNFVDGIAGLKGEGKEQCTEWPNPNEKLLVCTGQGAAMLNAKNSTENDPGDVLKALALIRRSIAFFVGAVALMTLSGLML